MLRSRRAIALGMLLVGMFAGAVGAQVAQAALQARYLNTALFSVAEGTRLNFHVSLDDARGAPPATVLLQLFNRDGAVVASKQVTLAAGKSTTLTYDGPAAFVRAHARGLDSVLGLVDRRTLVGTVELIDRLTAEQKFVCTMANDGSGPNRLPDP
jgi:hypothetical protein